MPRIDERTEQSAWVYYFNQAVSDLTGMVDEVADGEVKITGPAQADSLTAQAGKIADAAIRALKERGVPDDYWPVATQ